MNQISPPPAPSDPQGRQPAAPGAGLTVPAIDHDRRHALYARSLADPDGFWLDQAARLAWTTPPTKAGDWSFQDSDFRIRWFEDGVLNAAVNCIDRHLPERSAQPAIIWEPDDPRDAPRIVTYAELHREVGRLANLLRDLGVGKGGRVTLYLPMIPEAAFAMLACARIGAIHSVVFAGFSADALAGRIADSGSRVVITADEGRRGGKRVALKQAVDAALRDQNAVEHVVVVRATGAPVAMRAGRDQWYDEAVAGMADDCPPAPMAAEDPLFILYTSGSTGRPKGVVHTTGGYLLWSAMTHSIVFDYRAPEVFWCAADIGWITGHSYIVYGPLANGATTLMYEGVPTWPGPARMWQVVDRHRVAALYTAPTVIRALMREGDDHVRGNDRSSLRLLGSVGEPINPESWRWYHAVVGEGRCPIVDTWWQTETGGHMIAPLPSTPLKPGSATLPFFGVEPRLVDADGAVLEGEAEGNLVVARSWPGQMRGLWQDDDRFRDAYFRLYPGYYTTGDGARRDADGYYWITGRVDDVINVSGHRIGTAEVESALVLHPAVAEAAVVGHAHPLKGQGIYAFATLKIGCDESDALRAELRDWVRRQIGPIATPDAIQFAPAMPKTRSGKIMRRILRKVADGDVSDMGDTSTLADPAVVPALVQARAVLHDPARRGPIVAAAETSS